MAGRKDPHSLRGSINEALIHVRKLLPGGTVMHDLSERDRERLAVYLNCWVIPPLERALSKSGRKKSTN